jgi:hypothetical protein
MAQRYCLPDRPHARLLSRNRDWRHGRLALVLAAEVSNALATTAPAGSAALSPATGRSYEIRFPARDLPPHGADGFWSITLYNSSGYLVASPINHYLIGNETPGLVQGAGGSLAIVVSASRPSEPDANWLPAPAGAFSLVLRVYDPAPSVLDGSWVPPAIQTIG